MFHMPFASILEPASMLWRAWRYRFRHDRPEIAYLRQHLKPGDTAMDIGAHKGAYTWWMARAVGPAGRVLSFEPQPVLADRLEALTHHPLVRGTLQPVRVCPLALSDHQGQSLLHVDSANPTPNATLGTLDTQQHSQPYMVETMPLDTWLAQNPVSPPALIKVDVEGHEFAVFTGAEQTLRRHRPALIFECELRHHGGSTIRPIFEYLADLGYQGWFPLGRQWLPVDRFDGDQHQVPGQRPYVNNFLFK